MNKPLMYVLFGLMVVAQLAVPASMIAKREITLSKGSMYKFSCAPVDPYDAFRGKYVRLGVTTVNDMPWKGAYLDYGQEVYVTLKMDEEGFAEGDSISLDKPNAGDYVKAKVRWNNSQEQTISLELPFDRYYMEESIAPEAERAYWQANRQGQQTAYITVRVRDGFGVLEELYIEDLPILEYLAKDNAKK